MNFVHLKATSEFSITQSINRIPDLINKASKDGMESIALTDKNGLFGAVNFYTKARAKGLKPILGIDITIEQDDGNTYQLTILAKNDNGYRKIIELNTKSYLENRSEGVAAKEEWLGLLEDVIVLSGGKQGLIGQFILDGKVEEAKDVAQNMKDFFGEDFYIELERDGTPEETPYMDGAIAICTELNIAPVATHPNFFLEPDDYLAHEARYCIGSKKALFDMKREKPFNKEMYFKTKEEMTELFSDLPQALENSVLISQKCNSLLSLDEPKLPNFPTPNGESADEYFAILARKGLEERLNQDFQDSEKREAVREKYEARLEREIKIIQDMGFPGYFLIVADFINWAKENDIPVGPGRGSGAGSLVAYSMKITDLDPLPYNLLFERFLNPERVSMPDFDIDFCQSRRNEVYEYVRQKYGTDAVSQIGTFGTMAAKAVVRDVGRTLDYSYSFVDNIAKMIRIPLNKNISLKQFIFGDDDRGILPDDKLYELYTNEQDVKKLIDIALKIEGITRQVGTHAAGVVISPTILTDFTPLYTSDKDAAPSTQFNMKDVESSGLVKFDFLGLRNLTIIKETTDLINQRKLEKNEELFNLKNISLDDPEVYKNIFVPGNTGSIFQFEGKGMTSVVQRANPSKLEDLTAITSLYRPGPMAIIPDWLHSKSLPPEQREYPDPKLKDILEETYGFFVYQEQVMQCAQIIAGYSLGGADLLRRAMGKKKPEEMAQQRSIFIEGAKKNGVSEERANSIFDLMEKFAEYGFNKSHAAAYSYVSFQTAYLKNYYPEEFFTATMNSHIDDTDKLSVILDDAINKNNLSFGCPDINKSYYKFNIEDERFIRYGLGALKGVGEVAINTIVQDREKNGPYTDFYDFLERVGRGAVNKRVVESLVRSGAFDSLHPNRAQLFEAIKEGLDYVTKFRKKQMSNTPVISDSIFGDTPPTPVKKSTAKPKAELIRPTLQDITPWDELEKLKNEKAALGLFFSSNPYDIYYKKQLGGFEVALPLIEIQDYHNFQQEENPGRDTMVFVGGLIEEIKWWPSKKGAFVTISDGTHSTSVMMFEDFLNDNKEWLKVDAFVALRLKVTTQYSQKNEMDEMLISTVQIFNFETTKQLLTNKIFIGSDNDPELIQKFEKICNNHIGRPEDNDALAILCLADDKGRKSIKHKEFYVKANEKFNEEMISVFGEDWVKANFKKDINNIEFPPLPYKKNNRNNNNKKRAFSN